MCRQFFAPSACLTFFLTTWIATSAWAQVCPVPFELLEGTLLSTLGKAVASAGDVNGDGFDDVIVGAPRDDAGFLNNPGRAFLFLGGPNADQIPDLIMTGTREFHAFGTSVAGIGDYNGDGFDDFMVGAPGGLYAQPLNYPGDAYIYFGGLNPDSTPDVHFSGEINGDSFGDVVTGIGDFNVDGYPDIAIGAPFFSTQAGKAYVYYGGPSADTVADGSLVGTADGTPSYLGDDICAAGDMNGDGFDDFAIGNRGVNGLRGQAFLILGRPNPAVLPSTVYTGSAGLEQLGASLWGVGDINNDGFDDLAVGSLGTKIGLYFGGPILPNNTVDLTITGPPDEFFGANLGSADVNNDGFPDLLAGAERYGTAQEGRIYVMYGGPLLDSSADLILNGEPGNGGGLGSDVSSAGDFDGDGREDIVAGATRWQATTSVSPTGAVYLFPGAALIDCDNDRFPDLCQLADGSGSDCNLNGILDSCDLGTGTSTDCNANGVPDSCDLANGFPDCNHNGTLDSCDVSSGLSKDCDGTGVPDECESIAVGVDCNANGVLDTCDLGVVFRADGTEFQSEFGHALAVGGDFDGDGSVDLMIGVASEPVPQGPGSVHFFAGGLALDNNVDIILLGQNVGDKFGVALDFIGDFNGDGYDDFVVGAPGYDPGPSNAGRAYIYFGGPGADSVADVTLDAGSYRAFGGGFGQTVAAAGDVNNDGFGDVLVSSPGSNQSTRLFLFLGSSQYPPGWQITPSQSFGTLGPSYVYATALAGGGDINGDSYDDVLVGSYHKSSSGPGQVEIMLGGPNGLSVFSILQGPTPGDRFGFSVSFAGDQNGDVFDDILVGAPFDSGSGAGFQSGRAYLYYGGPTMDAAADLAFSPPILGPTQNGRFGITVTGGRDLNADGLSDMVIGQSAQKNGGVAGRAYVFYGDSAGDVQLDRLIVGELAGDELGRAVALVGDLNGDGLEDLAVGAPSASFLGRVDVYDVRANTFFDCNNNGIGDACDIESGFAMDTNANGIPDGCEAVVAAPTSPESQLRLHSATPNPFNPSTELAFELPAAGRTRIDIYDIRGHRVRALLSASMSQGHHKVQWDGRADDGSGISSGIYFARLSLEAGTRIFEPRMMKVTLLK